MAKAGYGYQQQAANQMANYQQQANQNQMYSQLGTGMMGLGSSLLNYQASRGGNLSQYGLNPSMFTSTGNYQPPI